MGRSCHRVFSTFLALPSCVVDIFCFGLAWLGVGSFCFLNKLNNEKEKKKKVILIKAYNCKMSYLVNFCS